MADFDRTWTSWATRNADFHWRRGPLYATYGSLVNAVQVHEQAGYGIIDLRCKALSIHDPEQSECLPWSTGNMDVQWERTPTDSFKDAGFVGVVVKEQPGYGLVDLRGVYRDAQGNEHLGSWLCDNPNGKERKLVCPDGEAITGIDVTEQAGYGIIDIRLASTQLGRIAG